MVQKTLKGILFFCLYWSAGIPQSAGQNHQAFLSKINLPPGFHITIFATGLTQPRSLAVDFSTQTVYVGTRQTSVYSLRDLNGDGVAEEVLERATGLRVPNGGLF